jgi:hypothetical protein
VSHNTRNWHGELLPKRPLRREPIGLLTLRANQIAAQRWMTSQNARKPVAQNAATATEPTRPEKYRISDLNDTNT